MRRLCSLVARFPCWVTLALSSAIAFAPGCGTDPVGVDDCRSIEQARCEAAKPCGLITDVSACQRFYRDECLHGLAVSSSPGSTEVEKCAAAVRAAGRCEAAHPREPLSACVEA